MTPLRYTITSEGRTHHSRILASRGILSFFIWCLVLNSAYAFNLTVEKSYEGSGDVSGGSIACGSGCGYASQSNIPNGTSLTLTASPSAGSIFLNWGGDCSGSNPTCTVTVDSDKMVTALFQTQVAMSGPTANNILEPGEACDGTDLGGMTALTLPGFKSGTLNCKSDRSGFDTSELVKGNIITAASCSAQDVQAAVDQAQDGDTVQVPAGTCSWTTTVNLGQYSYHTKSSTSKSITFRGAGIDVTNIIYKMSAGFALQTSIQAGKIIRITGLTFNGQINRTAGTGAINIGGDVGGWARIDHVKITNLYSYGMIFTQVYGIVDHCVFIKSPTAGSVTEIALNGDTTIRTGDPLDSWARPPTLGTAKAIYLEDNTFDLPNIANGPEDAYEGTRFVMRNNHVYGINLGWHGFDSSYRGIFQYEIYNNHMVNGPPSGPVNSNYPHGLLIESRSGSGVIFNNVAENGPGATPQYGTTDLFFLLRNYRSGAGYIPNSGGVYPWDGKSPWNGMCDGTNSNDLNYPGLHGYPCRDQTGRTTNQALMPTYVWNNNFKGNMDAGIVVGGYATFMCTAGGTLVSKNENPAPGNPISWVCTDPKGGPNVTYHEWINQHIVQGRDYYVGIKKPGYVPYVYPHPLVQSGGPDIQGPPLNPTFSAETAFLPFKNVFNPTHEVLYVAYTSDGKEMTLTIYARNGEKVRKLEPQNGIALWDGRNNSGSVVAAGTYILVLKQGGVVQKKKVVVVK